ncbi:MAG TPA: alpha/beta fold hydrolase, partial [Myxococcales bacterium]|nr:alpha/beta fold hydrolase [Myxococcales bacterium]
MTILAAWRGTKVNEHQEVERAVEAAARGEPARARLWLALAAQRRRLGLSARRILSDRAAEMQAFALLGVPDLRLEWLRRLSHAALIAQGAESWTGMVGGYRVHRYAFAGGGNDLPVLLLHGLGGSADSVAPLVAPLLPLSARVVLLELPGHGRSPQPPAGPLPAREYGKVVVAAVDRLHSDYGKVVLVGNSLGGALALHAAH